MDGLILRKTKDKMKLFEDGELEFLKDILKNFIIFIIITIVAVVLSIIVHYMETNRYPNILVYTLAVVENLLFLVDALWFVLKIFLTTVLLVWREIANFRNGINEIRKKQGDGEDD